MLIAVSLTSPYYIQTAYCYKLRHVLFISQRLAFVCLYFSLTSTLLLSYKNYHVTMVGKIHLCNCSSLVLHHSLSSGKNISDLSTLHGKNQKIKTIQQFLSASTKQQQKSIPKIYGNFSFGTERYPDKTLQLYKSIAWMQIFHF